MYESYVLKSLKDSQVCYLEEIKPEELLWVTVYGNEIEYSIYKNLSQKVQQLFNTLSERECEILKLRFGFYGYKFSLREAGRIMELSDTRVGQIEKLAIRRLRYRFCTKKISNVPKRGELTKITDEMKNYQNVFIKKIEAYVLGNNVETDFFANILKKNELELEWKTDFVKIDDEEIILEELELGTRTYYCLKRYGVNTLADLIRMLEERPLQIINLGRKSNEEILAKIKAFKLGENQTKFNQLTLLKIVYQGVEHFCTLKETTANDIAEKMYEMLSNKCALNGTIIEYSMSFELKEFLLDKGYIFIDDILKHIECVKDEIKSGMHEKYVNEFGNVINKIKDMIDSEINPKKFLFAIKEASVKNIIQKKPKTRDELLKCLNSDSSLKRSMIDNVSKDISIVISDNISLDSIDKRIKKKLENEKSKFIITKLEEKKNNIVDDEDYFVDEWEYLDDKYFDDGY